MACPACREWADHQIELAEDGVRTRCAACGHVGERPGPLLPLFIVTGASGAGKTAIVEELQRLLPEWQVFETDILWDSAGDWHFVRSNWLRIACALAATGRPTILCGTHLPEQIDRCDHRSFFPVVHYLILHCDDATRAARLRARPPWRGCTEAFIAEHRRFAAWLLEHAATAFDPPAEVLDTTSLPASEVARRVRDWALARWPSGHRH